MKIGAVIDSNPAVETCPKVSGRPPVVDKRFKQFFKQLLLVVALI